MWPQWPNVLCSSSPYTEMLVCVCVCKVQTNHGQLKARDKQRKFAIASLWVPTWLLALLRFLDLTRSSYPGHSGQGQRCLSLPEKAKFAKLIHASVNSDLTTAMHSLWSFPWKLVQNAGESSFCPSGPSPISEQLCQLSVCFQLQFRLWY